MIANYPPPAKRRAQQLFYRNSHFYRYSPKNMPVKVGLLMARQRQKMAIVNALKKHMSALSTPDLAVSICSFDFCNRKS